MEEHTSQCHRTQAESGRQYYCYKERQDLETGIEELFQRHISLKLRVHDNVIKMILMCATYTQLKSSAQAWVRASAGDSKTGDKSYLMVQLKLNLCVQDLEKWWD